MIEFRRNKETGILEAYKNGKYVGNVITMGDEITKGDKDNEQSGSKKLHPGSNG